MKCLFIMIYLNPKSLHLIPNKKCSLIVSQFSYNPFILKSSNKYPSISVKEALSELNIEFSDEPVYDQINECRATPLLKMDTLPKISI